VYLTPLIGGWLADKFIGTGRSLVIGGVVIAAGHFLLAFAPETAGPGGASPVGGTMARSTAACSSSSARASSSPT
jgi:dipeptide/tripeptide permease